MECLAFSALSFNGAGPALSFNDLVRFLPECGIRPRAFIPRSRVPTPSGIPYEFGLPWPLRQAPWSLIGKASRAGAEAKLLEAARRHRGNQQGVLYSFPDLSLPVLTAIREEGFLILREMTNTHRGTAQRIMSEAYEREGLGTFTAIPEHTVSEEREWLAMADAVFAPSAAVEDSLRENGVAESRIVPCGRGFDPTLFQPAPPNRPANDVPVALFVGSIGFRKGVHLLLRAWKAAGEPGLLRLIGQMDERFARHMAAELALPSVEHIPYTKEVAPHYRAADFFCLPSLEEGSPKVTYEAAASGLPIIATKMGGGRVLEDGVNGIVVDAYDVEGMAHALRLLATDCERRRAFADQAHAHVQRYVWRNESHLRGQVMLEMVAPDSLQRLSM